MRNAPCVTGASGNGDLTDYDDTDAQNHRAHSYSDVIFSDENAAVGELRWKLLEDAEKRLVYRLFNMCCLGGMVHSMPRCWRQSCTLQAEAHDYFHAVDQRSAAEWGCTDYLFATAAGYSSGIAGNQWLLQR